MIKQSLCIYDFYQIRIFYFVQNNMIRFFFCATKLYSIIRHLYTRAEGSKIQNPSSFDKTRKVYIVVGLSGYKIQSRIRTKKGKKYKLI